MLVIGQGEVATSWRTFGGRRRVSACTFGCFMNGLVRCSLGLAGNWNGWSLTLSVIFVSVLCKAS